VNLIVIFFIFFTNFTASAEKSFNVCPPNRTIVPSPTERILVLDVDYWGSEANELQEVVVKIISTEHCRRPDWYGLARTKVDTKTMICAGYEQGGRDSCHGDSGGPLACRGDNGRYKLIGVVSWGARNCGSAKKPGVYAKTAAVLDWIKTYVKGARMHFCCCYFSLLLLLLLLLLLCYLSRVELRRIELLMKPSPRAMGCYLPY